MTRNAPLVVDDGRRLVELMCGAGKPACRKLVGVVTDIPNRPGKVVLYRFKVEPNQGDLRAKRTLGRAVRSDDTTADGESYASVDELDQAVLADPSFRCGRHGDRHVGPLSGHVDYSGRRRRPIEVMLGMPT